MQIFIKQYKCIRLLTSNPFIIKKGRPVPKDSMVFRYLHLLSAFICIRFDESLLLPIDNLVNQHHNCIVGQGRSGGP